MFKLRALGGIDVRSPDGSGVDQLVAQPKRLALFAYLAIARPRGFHRRDKLIGMFWPDTDEWHARASLRKSLHVLRRTLGVEVVVTRGAAEVGLRFDHLWCDAVAFYDAIEAGRWTDALILYQGNLLDGLFVSEAPFERWLDDERRKCRAAAGRAAREELASCLSMRDLPQAVEFARRAMDMDPSEPTLRQLIKLLEQLGDPRAAEEAYRAYAFQLEREYETEPAAETRELMEQVRRRVSPPRGTARVAAVPMGSADGSRDY